MPAIAGLRGTGDWGADERPKNFREMILWSDPNGEAPMQALLSKMGSESTDDPEFSWWEETLSHVRLKVTTLANDSATTFTVEGDATAAVKGDLFIVEAPNGMWTTEVVRVVEDPSSDTSLKVVRGFSGSAAASVAKDTFLTKIGNAFAEGTLSPKSTTRNPEKRKNFTQIFKTTYEISGTAEVTNARTGNALKNDKKRKLFDVNRDMEMAMLYGQASETVGDNGKPMRTTGGLLSFIKTNKLTFGSEVSQTDWTEDNLIDFFGNLFNYNANGAGNERIAFIGNQALTEINKLARNSNSTRINFDKAVTDYYGMRFHRWMLPQGDIYFKTHPLFNIHPVLSKSMMVVNPKGLVERPLRKLNFKDNVQPPDADYKKGQWLAETGLEVQFEETMAFASNLGG